MAIGGVGGDLGKMASELAQRVKAMLTPMEDVCRYREQRSEDIASYDVTPRNKQAFPFKLVIAPGGANITTSHFEIREFPVTEAVVVERMIEAFLSGRVRRVTRLSASGKVLAAKVFVFDGEGRILYKNHRRAGALAGLTRTARRGRERFAAYRARD